MTGNCTNQEEENYSSVASTQNSSDVDASIYPQSGIEVKQEILTFVDPDKETVLTLDNGTDETRNRVRVSDNSLGEFLSRPVKIASFSWSTGIGSFYQNFDPWDLFLTNTRVSNRISNFKLGKMKLHVKFMVNGNSFFYGRLMACYLPFDNADEMTQNAGAILQHNVQMSQLPRIFIDPTTSQGGELVLPFFYHMDYLDLTYPSWEDLGTVTLRTLNDLKHVQGTAAISEIVTISVFAWATEVDLQAPTHVNSSGISPQSGKDEYEGNTGPISKPASAIAATAAALAVIPALKPYATATSIAAGATAKIASALGYSAPNMVEEPQYVLPRSNANMAVTNTPDSSAKLTVDCKQELTIDPRVLGLSGVDEMSITHLATRDSYLTKFDWIKAAPVEGLLWNAAVDPCLHRKIGNDVFMPACCGVTVPFLYWTGSMEFRFQIVASAFHRGRLAIVYDADSTPATRESNVAYTEIIDISTCREFSMKIANHQTTGILPHIEVGPSTESDFMGTARVTPSMANGTISVWVINALTSSATDPTINDDIAVNVFVKAGDDFEVFVPDDSMKRLVIKPQSGADPVDPVVEDNAPYPGTDVTIGTTAPIVSHRNLVYSGEKITSFRQLLKRYYHHSAFALNGTGDRLVLSMRAFPFYRGNVDGAVHDRVGPFPYNFCGITMINWLTPAFQAMRGAIRYKIVPKNNTAGYFPGDDTYYVARTRNEPYDISIETFDNLNPGRVCRSAVFNQDGQAKINGATSFNTRVNPVVEFEVPYYSRYRFSPGKQTNWTVQNTPTFEQGFQFWAQNEQDGSSYFDTWVSAGEDFTLNFFTGWPRMTYEALVPNPV